MKYGHGQSSERETYSEDGEERELWESCKSSERVAEDQSQKVWGFKTSLILTTFMFDN